MTESRPQLIVTDHTGLERIRHLWEGLNRHHEAVSPHFPHRFRSYTFDARKAELEALADAGELCVAIARSRDKDVGYCVAHHADSGAGEILSIYLMPDYRGRDVAHRLMNTCLDWLRERGASPISVNVVHGNERAHAFYSRFGFRHASSRLTIPDGD